MKNSMLKIQNWYAHLSAYTFPSAFVKLKYDEIQSLANGVERGRRVRDVVSRLAFPMRNTSGSCFVATDQVAPTDTVRFRAKRGAVHSPQSAWRYLAQSDRVREAAKHGEVEYLCVKPFRKMNQTREFRLFIHEGKLVAMSQYYLIRHFRRLEGYKNRFWRCAKSFVEDRLCWMLPVETVVMDIYITSDYQCIIIDLNEWGEKTNPLLLRTWDQDWSEEKGIFLMKPPTRISGDVNVSF